MAVSSGGQAAHAKCTRAAVNCQSRDSAPTLLNVAVTASLIGAPRSGNARRSSRVLVFHCRRFNSLSYLLSERLAYNGRAWTRVDERRKQTRRQRASSSIVGRWEHKIEDVLVDRLHRLSISSQLVHSVLAQTYLWPYPPSIRLHRRTCGPGAIPRQFGCNSTHQNLIVRYLTRRCSILGAASLPRGRSLAPARLPFSLGRRTGDITS